MVFPQHKSEVEMPSFLDEDVVIDDMESSDYIPESVSYH